LEKQRGEKKKKGSRAYVKISEKEEKREKQEKKETRPGKNSVGKGVSALNLHTPFLQQGGGKSGKGEKKGGGGRGLRKGRGGEGARESPNLKKSGR